MTTPAPAITRQINFTYGDSRLIEFGGTEGGNIQGGQRSLAESLGYQNVLLVWESISGILGAS